jgi:hypothetical protein
MSQINGTVARQYEACASDTQDTCRVERSEKEGGRTFAGAEPPPKLGSDAETRQRFGTCRLAAAYFSRADARGMCLA